MKDVTAATHVLVSGSSGPRFCRVSQVYFGLAINRIPSKWRPVESGSCCNGEWGFERTCMSYPEGQPE